MPVRWKRTIESNFASNNRKKYQSPGYSILNIYFKRSIYLSIYFMRVPKCLCTICMKYLRRPEERIRVSPAGVPSGCEEPDAGAGN